MLKNTIAVILLFAAFTGYSQSFTLSNEKLVERISYKPQKARVVIDTDTYNEIDDQFALVYAVLSQNQLSIATLNTTQSIVGD